MEEQIQDYINKMRTADKSDPEIKQELRNTEWKDEMFASYFDNTDKKNSYQPPTSRNKVLVLVIVFVVVILIAAGAFYFLNNSDSDKSTNSIVDTNQVVTTQSNTNNEPDTETQGCVIKEPTDINFEVLISDLETGKHCQTIYEESLSLVNATEDQQDLIKWRLQLCMNSALTDSKDITVCSLLDSVEAQDRCISDTTIYISASYCDCQYISDEETRKNCYDETPAILKELTIQDLPASMRSRPDPIEYELYSTQEYIENVVENNDGSLDISSEFHFSKLDPRECITIVESTGKLRGEDPFESTYYYNCIFDLAKISADESICDLFEDVDNQNFCKSVMAWSLSSPVMCFSITRPDDLSEEEILSYSSGSFTQCISQSRLFNGEPTQESCDLLGETIDGNPSLMKECQDRLDYLNSVDDSTSDNGG